MITKEMLKIYQDFNGDIDGWARVGTPLQKKKIMKDEDWSVIESLIQDISISNRGAASNTFLEVLNGKLNKFCDSAETIATLRNMATPQ